MTIDDVTELLDAEMAELKEDTEYYTQLLTRNKTEVGRAYIGGKLYVAMNMFCRLGNIKEKVEKVGEVSEE